MTDAQPSFGAPGRYQPAATSTVKCRSLLSELATRQAALRLFEQLLRPFDVGAGGDMQLGVSIEARESHLAFDAVQGPFGARLEADARKTWMPPRSPETQDEAIRNGRRQQSFGRPLIARTIEFLGRTRTR